MVTIKTFYGLELNNDALILACDPWFIWLLPYESEIELYSE